MKKQSPRRMTILRQAAKIFHKQGYKASTIRQLAKQCSIQSASIYYHFSSKQEILFEIMDHTMTTLIYQLKESIKHKNNPLDKLYQAIEFHILYHIQSPHLIHVTDAEIRSLEPEYLEQILQKRREYEKIFNLILQDSADQGLIKVDNIALTRIAILQMCTGITIWFRKDGSQTVEQVVKAYIQFIRYGVIGRVKKLPLDRLASPQ